MHCGTVGPILYFPCTLASRTASDYHYRFLSFIRNNKVYQAKYFSQFAFCNEAQLCELYRWLPAHLYATHHQQTIFSISGLFPGLRLCQGGNSSWFFIIVETYFLKDI